MFNESFTVTSRNNEVRTGNFRQFGMQEALSKNFSDILRNLLYVIE